jgi:hypothetical protein
MEWGLIEPDIAHYMFGYYALHCANCRAFWVGVGQWNPYWDRFRKFCHRMEIEREASNGGGEIWIFAISGTRQSTRFRRGRPTIYRCRN